MKERGPVPFTGRIYALIGQTGKSDQAASRRNGTKYKCHFKCHLSLSLLEFIVLPVVQHIPTNPPPTANIDGRTEPMAPTSPTITIPHPSRTRSPTRRLPTHHPSQTYQVQTVLLHTHSPQEVLDRAVHPVKILLQNYRPTTPRSLRRSWHGLRPAPPDVPTLCSPRRPIQRRAAPHLRGLPVTSR
jgi:hypothetical protein